MIDFCFGDALECPQEEFDKLVSQLNDDLRCCAGDYMEGLVGIEDIELKFNYARCSIVDALQPHFRLNGANVSYSRYRCSSDESFDSLLDDYSRWKDGMPMLEHPGADWLFVYNDSKDGKPAFVSATYEQRARLFRLCDTCAYSVRRFAHVFDGVKFPKYRCRGYGTESYYHILEDFTEDGGF